MYRARLKFLDVDPMLEASVNLGHPSPANGPRRRGPIKVKVNVEALERAVALGRLGANRPVAALV